MKRQNVPFDLIDQARHEAGFSLSETCQKLAIAKRTWYRWQESGSGPKWAYQLLKFWSGDLEMLGMPGWFLKRGVIYSADLNPKYYRWRSVDLLSEAFWRANGKRPGGHLRLAEADDSVVWVNGVKPANDEHYEKIKAPSIDNGEHCEIVFISCPLIVSPSSKRQG